MEIKQAKKAIRHEAEIIIEGLDMRMLHDKAVAIRVPLDLIAYPKHEIFTQFFAEQVDLTPEQWDEVTESLTERILQIKALEILKDYIIQR